MTLYTVSFEEKNIYTVNIIFNTKKKKKISVYILGGNLAIWINKFIDYK